MKMNLRKEVADRLERNLSLEEIEVAEKVESVCSTVDLRLLTDILDELKNNA